MKTSSLLCILALAASLAWAQDNNSATTKVKQAADIILQMTLLDMAAPLFDISPDSRRVLAVTPADPEVNSIGYQLAHAGHAQVRCEPLATCK